MDHRILQHAGRHPTGAALPAAPEIRVGSSQRMYAVPSEENHFNDFALPVGSLYSLAAQEDAAAMEQEQAAVTSFQRAQPPSGMNRAPFFRPYQPAAGPSSAATAIPPRQQGAPQHFPTYRRPPAPNAMHMAPQPMPAPPPPHIYSQRQQFFSSHPQGLGPFDFSQTSSSPSPAYRARDQQAPLEPITPSQSDEGVFAYDPDMDVSTPGAGSSRQRDALAYSQQYAQQSFQGVSRQPLRPMQQVSDHAPSTAQQGMQATSKQQSAPNKSQAEPRNRHRVQLKPVMALPDMWQTIFKFPVFNAVQSMCFGSSNAIMHGQVFESDRNLVVSAPTGSGKTVVFELAIIRMLQKRSSSAKAVYLAPTKALCSERAKDWSNRLGPLGCDVVEITGDTSFAGLSAAKHARVIVTTPEKWDVSIRLAVSECSILLKTGMATFKSLTRRWSDHDKILSSLALLLIDEVHILHEKERGARLEVIVSRMKNYGQAIRFIALSATVPNLQDVAEWISRNASVGPNPKADEQGVPTSFADLFKFGDEYRPCRLSKFVYGYPKMKDDFAFTGSLNKHLTGLIKEHAKAKPSIVFVSTRKGTVQAADAVAKEVTALEQRREPLPWAKPTSTLQVQDPKLEELSALGIAFHHAGMELDDRRAVEQAFLSGAIKVLCATTTLATGVNLPAYCVIIRGTKQYATGGWSEISDLDFVQMIGRAGRPQFDSEGVAVVMTENDQKQHYMDLASGNTVIESSLAAELVEHINAELVLRGTSNKRAIERWIEGTFLHVRLLKNPSYYNLDESAASKSSKEVLSCIVERALQQLDQYDLATSSGQDAGELAATDFGDILAKYFLSFKTMMMLLQIPNNTTTKELLDLLTEAEEFKDLFVALCKNEEIRFAPAKVNGVKDKISLLIQAVLAGMSLQECLGSKAGGYSPTLDAFLVFRHAPRIVKAMFDIFLAKQYGQALHHAFSLLRCINGRSWEGKPTVLRQLEGVGEKTYKILSGSGILSVADVAATDPRRIEMLLNRNPPFGDKLVNNAKSFPHFHLDVEQVSHEVKEDGVQIVVKVKAGLTDMGVKVKTTRKESRAAMAMCILTMSSDLILFDFRKMPLKKVTGDKEFKVTCKLQKPSQRITVTAACDDIAGSAVRLELRHGIPASAFPDIPFSATSRQDLEKERALQELEECIDFFDKDGDVHLDSESDESRDIPPAPLRPKATAKALSGPVISRAEDEDEIDALPEKLPNGNYKCLHTCKANCRHLCCREGMERPPQRKKSLKKKQNEADRSEKAGAEQSQTLLDRLRQTSDGPSSSQQPSLQKKNAAAVKPSAARSGSQAMRQEMAGTSSKKVSFKSPAKATENTFSEDDSDELPLQVTRKRKYDVNWSAFNDEDEDDDDLPEIGRSQNSTRALPTSKKAKRAKVSFSDFIDDEAGEDNRPEHVARGKGKGKALAKAASARRAENASDEEDAGSLVDFIVEDDVDPSIHYSDDDGHLTKPTGLNDEVSRGDLLDRDISGLDDLANLFSDSEHEDDSAAAKRSGEGSLRRGMTSKTFDTFEIDEGVGFDFGPSGDDDPSLFVPDTDADQAAMPNFSSDAPQDGHLGQPKLGAGASPNSGNRGRGWPSYGPRQLPELINEDAALGIRDGPSPPPFRPTRTPATPEERPAAAASAQLSKPTPAVPTVVSGQSAGPCAAQPADAPPQRRAVFADRMLAKWRNARNDAGNGPEGSETSGALPETREMSWNAVLAAGNTEAEGAREEVQMPSHEEIWGDWDFLKQG
ncbi:ATP-dependent DNA helicase MER3 [Tilletia horrida]|nr:ATP-dependent DNA helicase MER3 [Tilletia horrida]